MLIIVAFGILCAYRPGDDLKMKRVKEYFIPSDSSTSALFCEVTSNKQTISHYQIPEHQLI